MVREVSDKGQVMWLISLDDQFMYTYDETGEAFTCNTDTLTELYNAIAKALFEAGEQA